MENVKFVVFSTYESTTSDNSSHSYSVTYLWHAWAPIMTWVHEIMEFYQERKRKIFYLPQLLGQGQLFVQTMGGKGSRSVL